MNSAILEHLLSEARSPAVQEADVRQANRLRKQIQCLQERLSLELRWYRQSERALTMAQTDAEAQSDPDQERKRALQVRMEILERSRAELDDVLSRRHDPVGLASVDAHLAAARVCTWRPIRELDRALAAVEESLEKHRQVVRASWMRHLESVSNAEERVAHWEVEIESLRSDPVVSAWCSEELEGLESILISWRSLLKQDKPEEVLADESSACEQRARILESSASRQLKEQHRAYLVRGLMTALQKDGFAVGDPEVLGTLLTGDVILRAIRPDGRRIDAAIPHQGPVRYAVDGYNRAVAVASDGDLRSSCDEAEAQLNHIHDTLTREFHVSMEDVWWEGKDPNRIRRGACSLPIGGAKRTVARGLQ